MRVCLCLSARRVETYMYAGLGIAVCALDVFFEQAGGRGPATHVHMFEEYQHEHMHSMWQT